MPTLLRASQRSRTVTAIAGRHPLGGSGIRLQTVFGGVLGMNSRGCFLMGSMIRHSVRTRGPYHSLALLPGGPTRTVRTTFRLPTAGGVLPCEGMEAREDEQSDDHLVGDGWSTT